VAHWRKDSRAPRAAPRFLGYWTDPNGMQRSRRLRGVSSVEGAKARIREIEARLAAGLYGDAKDQPVAPGAGLVVNSIEAWSWTLKNRNGYSDGQQARKHLVTAEPLKGVTLDRFDLGVVKGVVTWLETVDLSPGSRKNLFTILSRWASQATWDGLLQGNPCASLPRARRPPPNARDRTTMPWVKTDEELAQLMAALPQPLALALWIGNRSGLRLGETFGLRLSDVAELDHGWIRVCRSFGGPIKESKRGEWATKWVPATMDAPKVLGRWILARRSLGAGDDDLLFVPSKAKAGAFTRKRNAGWPGFLPHTVNSVWRRVQKETGFAGTWRDATRHSFASRHIMAGQPIEAVSRALNHASVDTTRKNYEHVIRIKYPEGLRAAGEGAAPPVTVSDDVKKLFGLR